MRFVEEETVVREKQGSWSEVVGNGKDGAGRFRTMSPFQNGSTNDQCWKACTCASI